MNIVLEKGLTKDKVQENDKLIHRKKDSCYERFAEWPVGWIRVIVFDGSCLLKV